MFRATERETFAAVLGGGGARIWQLGSPLFALLGHGPFLEQVSCLSCLRIAAYCRAIFTINSLHAIPFAGCTVTGRLTRVARGDTRIFGNRALTVSGVAYPGNGMLNNISAGGSVHGISGK